MPVNDAPWTWGVDKIAEIVICAEAARKADMSVATLISCLRWYERDEVLRILWCFDIITGNVNRPDDTITDYDWF